MLYHVNDPRYKQFLSASRKAKGKQDKKEAKTEEKEGEKQPSQKTT